MRTGTNLHVHCHHSFSVFGPPAEVVRAGIEAKVEAIGLNDFFTTAGYADFHAAARAARLPGIVSIECIAMDAACETGGVRLNDPANPGKIYLCGKAITRPDDAAAAATLRTLRGHQERRNQALVALVETRFRATVQAAGPSWNDVVSQTPAGNTTERHVAKAIQARVRALGGDFAALFTKVVGEAPKASDPDQQNQIRNALLKAGKPCYAPEERSAFPDVAGLRQVFLQLGAVPTYPVLGNPQTEGEADIPALFARIDAWGFRAVELIPARNTDDRVAAVLAECAKRGWPVTDGTEHNTAAMEPMTTKWGLDERFRPAFRAGAAVLLGHQALVASGAVGYVDEQGNVPAGSLARCREAGERELSASVAAGA